MQSVMVIKCIDTGHLEKYTFDASPPVPRTGDYVSLNNRKGDEQRWVVGVDYCFSNNGASIVVIVNKKGIPNV